MTVIKNNNETKITIDSVQLRDYQIPIFDAIFKQHKSKVLAILSRRAGKDMTALYCALYQLLQKTCKIYYLFPSYSAARKSAFDNIRQDGVRFIDFIPKELIKSINSSEMKITLINNSILQFIGGSDPSKLRGVQLQAVIYSEYAFFDYPDVRGILRPVLAATPGSWELIVTTPHGQNFLYDLYVAAKESDEWFVYHKGLKELKHIPYETAYQDVVEGLMSENMFKSEYLCDFTSEIDGSIYANYMEKMLNESRISRVPYNEAYPVWTSWDLGIRDSTSIVFAQKIGQSFSIIDSYENNNVSLKHYVEIIKSKPYLYAGHIFPHDIEVRELSSAKTRRSTLEALGIEVTVAKTIPVLDGIEAVRNMLGRVYMDEGKTIELVKALKNYHYTWDRNRGMLDTRKPYHDWSSNFCDSFRMLAVSTDLMDEDYSADQLEDLQNDAIYSSLGPRSYGYKG